MAMVEKLARGQYNTFFSCIEYFVSLQMCIKENVRWERKKENVFGSLFSLLWPN